MINASSVLPDDTFASGDSELLTPWLSKFKLAGDHLKGKRNPDPV
jgi:hypothetical protein